MDKLESAGERIDKVSLRMDALKAMFDPEETTDKRIEHTVFGFVINGKVSLETIYQNEDTTISIAKHQEIDTSYPKHIHAYSLEYLIVTRGRFTIRIDGGLRVMERGACATIPKGVEHTLVAMDDNSEMIAICIPPEKAYKLKDE